MTEHGSGVPEGTDDERAARLQALLTVDLSSRAAPDVERRLPEPAPPADPRRPSPMSVLSAVVLVALFATGIGLAYAGTSIIRTSTEGEVVRRVDDPAAPGFEALVEPTPTLAVLHEVGDRLDAITVLTLPDPGRGGGGVIMVPTRTVDDLPVFERAPLEVAYDFGATPQVQAEMVGDVLGVGIDEVVVVDASRWEGLVAPVAPLVVDNPDDLEVDGDLVVAAGVVELSAAEVGPYLELRGDDESDLGRLFRHELVWRAWLEAVDAAGSDAAVPGEVESGIGRFVRELAGGTIRLATLPVDRAPEEPGEEQSYLPDDDAIADLVADLVPFPRSPRPGARPRVRVLSGTADVEASRELAHLLPSLGLEVVIVGNATRLDNETTTIAYVGPEHEEAAEDIRDLLGGGEVVADPRPTDVADISVTLGADHD